MTAPNIKSLLNKTQAVLNAPRSTFQLSKIQGIKAVRKTVVTSSVLAAMALMSNVTFAQSTNDGKQQLSPISTKQQDSQSNDAMPISVYDSTNGIIALVNDTPILKSQLNEAIASTQARLEAGGQTVPSPQYLQNEVLNNLIMRELQLDLVKRAGIRPEPNIVDETLARIAQAQGLESITQLQQILDARQPGSYALLRARVAEDESLRVLQQSQIASRLHISEQDIDAFLNSPEAQKLQRTEYRTIHMRIPFSDDISRITDNEKQTALKIAQQTKVLLQSSNDAQAVLQQVSNGIAKNYIAPVQGGDMGYHEAAGLPTDIAKQITQLNVGDVTQPQMTPAGIDVVKLVDIRNDNQALIPQWKVRHILVKTDDLNNDALAEQKINDLYEQLRRDADFSALAKTYSDDPGSSGRGGDLDWVSEGQMVPEFEQMMKRTPEGDFSTPFRSQFGWHILKVEAQRQHDISEMIRRNQAREVLYKRLAPQAEEDWLQELRANAFVRIFQ